MKLRVTDLLIEKLGKVEDSPDEAARVKNVRDRMVNCLTVLAGLKIISRDLSSPGGIYRYSGPDVYSGWMRHWHDKLNLEYGLKAVSVAITREDYSEYPQPPRQNWRRTLGLSDSNVVNYGAFKTQVILEKTKSMKRETMTEEQLRSMDNIKRVCRCGTTYTDDNGKKVTIGNKRKHRCKKCEGCKTPKCGECTHCLKPSNKQACIKRVCLFPKVPDCKCFD